MKKLVLSLCLLLGVMSITGCSGSKEEIVEEAYQDDQGYTINRRGETVALGDWEVTYKESGASSATEDPSVYISINVKNNGSEANSFTQWMDFSGSSVGTYIVDKAYVDVEGYEAVKIMGGSNSDITDQDVEAGKDKDGSLYFSSPDVSSEEFNEAGYYLLLTYGEEYVVFLIEETKYK
ncbi:MAG: hypothetical protein ACK5LC_00875 [Coprobacillaceae bacterium]